MSLSSSPEAGSNLAVLRDDGERVLRRGWRDDGDGERTAVLAVFAASEPAPSGLVQRLAHEYALKHELDGRSAVRPLELVRENGRTTLLLADPGGEPLERLLGKPMKIGQFLHLAIGLSVALRHLHERGLIHKDIKPANALVNAATGQAWLMGFGITSRLPRERQSPEPPEFIAGSLPYMAPEQTGRMNRSIDSRSDLYALGVTLYEMLTGNLPFTASDPMEWVHCHIARQPVPPDERVADVPAVVSAIVLKLLSKTAEERYQTAAGVEADLRRCLAEWEARGHIGAFAPGLRDMPDRLLIPEKLYGRAREVDALVASFDRVVARGTPELVLVSGYSGVGKSSVVNELHKVLVRSRGLFAAGKFDQYKRDIPYATLAQAFQSLIRPLLGKREADLAIWRDALRAALDPNAKLIVDLIPELKLIIGEPPPVPDLPPQQAQSRFQMVFRRFVGVFARPEHPLALFLDDLQWLDAATLDLLEDLLSQTEVRHLLLIGAYRDNEVDAAHPLARRLKTIRQTRTSVQEISLTPLARADVGQLIADALRSGPEHAGALAQLVHEKTGGNPFFAIQFLHALSDEGMLRFDHVDARWGWDLTRIHAKGYTDNVVDLMVEKLTRLPSATRTALQHLACLGNVADIATLGLIHGTSDDALLTDLWEAVRQDLILRLEGAYRFIHDRVQEAAYLLIPEPMRAQAHLRIGRLLVAHTAPEQREDAIFEIVNQLNRGANLIAAPDEREQLAELNLIAGRRAKASTAHASALTYLLAGAALLPPDCWERRRELPFALELNRAECEFLTGALAEAEQRLEALASRAVDAIEQATVASLRMDLYTTLDQTDRAVGVCLDYLRHLGIEWSPHPTAEEGRREYERIWSQLGSRTIEELIDLPLMSDPASFATLDVLTKAVPPALFTDANLLSLAICRAVNLSLEHGNSDGSCFAYVWLGVIAGPHFGNYKAGFQFGQLGYDLIEKRGLKRFQIRTSMCFGNLVVPWTKHVRAGRDLLRDAFEDANRTGDLTFAAYSCQALNRNLLAAGDPLIEVQREAEDGLGFARKIGFGLVIDVVTSQLGLIRTLRGLTPTFGSFNDGGFDELQFERHLASDARLAAPECWYWIRKLQARFFAGDYASALEASSRAQRLLWTSPSHFETAEYHFYAALCCAACCDSAAPGRNRQSFEALSAHSRQLEVWAENGPETFENRAALVGAEIARVKGRELEAERLYDKAIRSARKHGFVQNEGIANELAARFHAERGFETIANAYLNSARSCYRRWGADGKVGQLERLHPHLRSEPSAPETTIGTPLQHLDMATVIKVSQAVSGEIDLKKLIHAVMVVALEHAGAERGLLILQGGDEYRIEAVATTGQEAVTVSLRQASISPAELPESVLRYVMRTLEDVIIDDASVANHFATDDYIVAKNVRSVLCLPFLKQGKLIGLLYLENNLTPFAFTPSRIAVLRIVVSQAAISLENARLYAELRHAEAFLAEAQRVSHTGSFGWNVSSGEVHWSDETFKIFGFDRKTKPTLDLVLQRTHPDDVDALRQRIDLAKRSGADWSMERRLLMPEGSIKTIQVVAHATRDESGGVEFVGAIMDVTPSKQAEEALHKAQAELQHATQMTVMGELAATIAHEVKQPLAGMILRAQTGVRWCKQGSPDIGQMKDAFERIAADGLRAAAVIDNIRASFRKGAQVSAPLDVNDLIAEALAFAQGDLQQHRITVHAERHAALPQVEGDRIQLQQVLLNLITNAIDAMAAAAEHRVLRVSSALDRGAVVVSVEDTGGGISPQDIERIFEPLFTTKPKGMGLGLSICRSIVESHGGRLWASPRQPCGSVFRFTLPTDPAE